MFDVVIAADNAAIFSQWRAEGRLAGEHRAQYGAFARHYYPVVYGTTHRDVSFAIAEGGVPLLYVAATVSQSGFDYYGVPSRFFSFGLPDESAVARAVEHIDQLTESLALPRVVLADDHSTGNLSALGRACLNRHFKPSLRLTGWADLSEGEAGLRRGLRKSYKSLLNWGKANMTIGVVGGENPDRELFDTYQRFHQSVAGRSTRPQAVWDALYSWIAGGRGELLLAFIEGAELVAATLVVDAEGSAYYGLGVYDRERFDKPMAHWPLWQAMLRAHGRGLTKFELGDIPLQHMADAKEVAIGYFKRGFATELAATLDWVWDIVGDT